MTTDVLDLPTLGPEPAMAAGPRHDRGPVADPALERCGTGCRSGRVPVVSWGDWAALGRPTASLASGPHGCGCRSPRSSAWRLRPAAEHGRHVQPAQRGQARPLHLPVLRSAAGRRVDHDRPRPAAVAGGSVELDQLRCRLRSGATPARGTAPLSRPACGSAAGRSGPSGSRSTPRRAPGSRAGPGS